jgi:O-antigen ligase
MSRPRLHPYFVIAGAFVLLAPLSVATGLSISEPAKYLRLATTLLIVGLALVSGRGLRMGPAGRALAAFVLLFVISGLWSDLPHWALFNKGMFALACFSGVALGNCVRSRDELARGLRLLGLIAAGAAVIAFASYSSDRTTESGTLGRMAVYGMNSNAVGQTAAPLLILCVHLALHERSRLWRWLMIFACTVLAEVILATGSRGAALMALAGSALLFVPLTRRPGTIAAAILICLVVGFTAFEVFDLRGSDRMITELSKNTRSGIWNYGFKMFLTSPVIGVGWVHWGDRWGALQSIYMQTLVEAGLIGALALAGMMNVVATRWRRTHHWLSRAGHSCELSWLALAFLVAVFLHGLAESSTFMGSSLNALLLGLGVCLIDRSREPALLRSAWKIAPQHGRRPHVAKNVARNRTQQRSVAIGPNRDQSLRTNHAHPARHS